MTEIMFNSLVKGLCKRISEDETIENADSATMVYREYKERIDNLFIGIVELVFFGNCIDSVTLHELIEIRINAKIKLSNFCHNQR